MEKLKRTKKTNIPYDLARLWQASQQSDKVAKKIKMVANNPNQIFQKFKIIVGLIKDAVKWGNSIPKDV